MEKKKEKGLRWHLGRTTKARRRKKGRGKKEKGPPYLGLSLHTQEKDDAKTVERGRFDPQFRNEEKRRTDAHC